MSENVSSLRSVKVATPPVLADYDSKIDRLRNNLDKLSVAKIE